MAITKLSNSGIKTGQLKYDSFLAGNDAYYPADFFSIATVSVGSGGTTSATFSNIPQTYKHLQIRAIFSSTHSSNYGLSSCIMQFNSDTANNYRYHYIQGSGSAIVAGDSGATNVAYGGLAQNQTYAANTFGSFVADIYDYTNTNKFKTIRSLNGYDNNGASNYGGYLQVESSLWRSTSAITDIVLKSDQSNVSLVQYSHFALYGIRG